MIIQINNAKIQNPWININWANTIADCDKSIISPTYCNKHGIDISNLPEPYTGDVDSNVYCLNLNPGIGKCDSCFRNDSELLRLTQETLQHQIDHHMWICDDIKCKLGGLHDGCVWWRNRTKTLQASLGNKRLDIFVLEFFPYHTKSAFNFPALPSDEYRNSLLERAMNDGKCIVIMRGKKRWFDIKADGIGGRLKNYKRKIEMNNPRNVSFSQLKKSKQWNELIVELQNNKY